MARRQVVSRGRTQRAAVSWGGTVATAPIGVPALTKVLIAVAGPTFPTGTTVRRMRGTFYVFGTSVGNFHGAVGSFVANDTAIGVGVGSLLDPVTDVSDDAWFWYQSFHGGGNGADSSGSAGADSSQVLTIDSKAMRRVDRGYSVVFVVGNSSAVQTFSVALSVRVLGSAAS